MRRVAALTTCFLSLAMLAACGSVGGSRAPVSARCSPASESLQAQIMVGVNIQPGGWLSSAYAVQSADFGDLVWRGPIVMVAAEIDGAGMGGTGDIGVWATAELKPSASGPSKPGHSAIYAVNELAKRLGYFAPGEGGWTDGSEDGLQFPMSADGVAEAMACAQAG